jgi:hypothetical protein
MVIGLGDPKGHDLCQTGYIPFFGLQHMEITLFIPKAKRLRTKRGEAVAAINVEGL